MLEGGEGWYRPVELISSIYMYIGCIVRDRQGCAVLRYSGWGGREGVEVYLVNHAYSIDVY